MRSSFSNPDSQPQYCYCPNALRELHDARDELIKVRTFLQARDPDYDARETLKAATRELDEARQLLQQVLGAGEVLEQLRDVPRLCTLAREALDSTEGAIAVRDLSRIRELMPAVERIEQLMDRLEHTEIRVVYADA